MGNEPAAAGPNKPEPVFQEWNRWLRKRLNDSQRFLILCILAGVLCGLVGVTFQLSINFLHDLLFHFHAEGHFSFWNGVLMLATPAAGGLIVGLVLTYVSPTSVGSGIPQTKQAYYHEFGVISWKDGLWRLLLGTLSVGSGNSLGREGPTVHICASLASTLGQAFGLAKARVQSLVPVGMGAGIAAAFNTPIAALFFVFEELLADFSSKALGGMVVAVVIAAIVERSLLGDEAALILQFEPMETAPWMLIGVPLGISAALLGHAFVSLLLWWRRVFIEQKKIPRWVSPAIGGLGVGMIGLSVFLICGQMGIFGTGHHDLNESLSGLLSWQALALLFIGKLLATAFCYGAGGSGGIFAPVLFMGSMLGGLFGHALLALFPTLPPETLQACALLGTGAFFAAVIRCKFTSMLMIIELTQSYTLVLPLMAGNLLAYSVSYRLRPVPIYDALLLQDGISLKKMPTYRGERDWRNLPVSTIMTYDVVSVLGTDSPAEALKKVNHSGKTHHAYPVLAGDGSGHEVVGMICHHELTEALSGDALAPISDLIQSQTLISLSPDASIRDVANTLVLEDVLQAPVVHSRQHNRLMGIVTLHDIARQQNAISETIGRG